MTSFPQLLGQCRQNRMLTSRYNAQSSFGNFTFAHRTQSVRLYGLGRYGDTNENKLLYVDVPYTRRDNTNSNNNESGDNGRLYWKPLHDFSSKTDDQNMSKEEELLRQRLRLLVGGIHSYAYHAESASFLFTSGSKICQLSDIERVTQTEIKTLEPKLNNLPGVPMDAKTCPVNLNILSFVMNDDLYVIVNNTQKRLTYAKANTFKDLTAGVASYIIQEEFDRYTGYWWCPVAHGVNRNTYYILVESNDHTDVERVNITESESMRYPRPGKANAKWNLNMVEITVNLQATSEEENCKVKLMDCSYNLRAQFPWAEYLVRAGWMPDGDRIWLQLMSRLQNQLQLVQISLNAFTLLEPEKRFSRLSEQIFIMYQQKSDLWIREHDCLNFISQDMQHNERSIKFIWSHNESGFDHLYLVESTYPESGRECLISESALTNGPYNVSRKAQLHLDRGRGLVYFLASKDTPLETHIHCASYFEVTEAKRLTHLGFCYGSFRESSPFSFSENNDFFVVCRSSLTNLGQCVIYSLRHSIVNPYLPDAQLTYIVSSQRETILDCSTPLVTVMDVDTQSSGMPIKQVEILSYQSRRTGFKHYACIWRPGAFCESKSYPTILHVYGGPEAQMVRNSYLGNINMQKYTNLGYVVVMVDGRGSANRGIQFEKRVAGNMGLFETDDQIEGLEHVSNTTKCIDMKRVAIIGWSYGGYLSLMGIAQRKDFFKVSIAGAPVTDWLLYDTAYTERYMGLPSEQNDNYAHSAVTSFAASFPDEPGRLLILHGLLDENVHFLHTAKLINALLKAGKPHQLQVYPNERHAMRNFDTLLHMDATILSFLQTNL